MKQYDPEGEVEGEPITYEKCDGKNRYSKHQAHQMKVTIGRGRDKDMRVYLCDRCHRYHLTKKSRRHDY
jgi:hypothetical protein